MYVCVFVCAFCVYICVLCTTSLDVYTWYMGVYMCICIYAQIYLNTYTHVHLYMCMCTYTHVSTYVHIQYFLLCRTSTVNIHKYYKYICIYVHIHIHIHTFMSICVSVSIIYIQIQSICHSKVHSKFVLDQDHHVWTNTAHENNKQKRPLHIDRSRVELVQWKCITPGRISRIEIRSSSYEAKLKCTTLQHTATHCNALQHALSSKSTARTLTGGVRIRYTILF